MIISDFKPEEQLNPAALVNLINGLAGQTVVQEGYQGIPFDKPFTAANAVGVKLDKGLLYSPKAPELEKPPTGEEILKPLTELMPDIKNLSISSKDVQCPVWSFELWDNKYSIDSHCELLEKIRPLLKAVFLLIWEIISLRIILSA